MNMMRESSDGKLYRIDRYQVKEVNSEHNTLGEVLSFYKLPLSFQIKVLSNREFTIGLFGFRMGSHIFLHSFKGN